MDATGWFLTVGLVLFGIGLTQPLIRRLPLTNTIVYLLVGIVLGPTVLGLFHFNPLAQSSLLAVITEIAVLLSLFTAGMKMPVPVRPVRWRTPILMAFIAMGVTAAVMAGFGYLVLDLSLGAAILLGGILAPTDPVLASDVQVRRPGDRNRLRFFLTAEAGMNDGSAFPVVMLGLGLLGLHELGGFGMRWMTLDLVWATVGGTGLGVLAGGGVGYLVYHLRRRYGLRPLFDDFIGLGMVGIVYGVSLLLEMWGFLAVFASAIALRQTEMRLATRAVSADPDGTSFVGAGIGLERGRLGVTDNSLDIHEALERFIELTLILLLGGMLFVDSWSWHAVAAALFLFFVARPLGVLAVSLDTRAPMRLRGMISWFGVRGIGSLYYLMFAIQQGVEKELVLELLHITLIVVTLSILVHGVSVKPMMARFRQRNGAGVAEVA